jgi:hypothetical protein
MEVAKAKFKELHDETARNRLAADVEIKVRVPPQLRGLFFTTAHIILSLF